MPVLLVFAVRVLLGLFCLRRSRSDRREREAAERARQAAEQAKVVAEKGTEEYRLLTRKIWQLAPCELRLMECIGSGAVGEVFRGQWRDMDVAVKTFRGVCMTNEEMESELDHEAIMLHAVRHAHVVQFFGAGTLEDGTPFMVVELMELGTLTGVLQDTAVDLDWPTRQRFAHETALGMALVHALGHMHRDLKSGNILVTRTLLGHMRVNGGRLWDSHAGECSEQQGFFSGFAPIDSGEDDAHQRRRGDAAVDGARNNRW